MFDQLFIAIFYTCVAHALWPHGSCDLNNREWLAMDADTWLNCKIINGV